ncbi:MAG: fasciclin domain-containing protein [Bacteroidota bacterium]
MKDLIRISFSAMLMLCLVIFTSCDDDNNNEVTPTPTTPNAVEFASSNADFSSLVAAVTQANLVETLSGPGPFTIFAPTNSAFQELLNSNPAWNSLSDIPNDVLTTVLTYHVVAGENRSTDLSTGYVESLSATPYGANASLYVSTDGGVTINGDVSVTGADNDVSNGVIHVVDKVIMPPSVVTFATSNPAFSSLVAALTRADLMTNFVEVLTGDGPFTVFAPTNEAFQALLDGNEEWSSLADVPVDVLEDVLMYHVTTAGNVRAGDLENGQTVPTLLDGESFTIDLTDGPKIVAGANTADIILTDVQGQNGVVHAIDAVILPSAFAAVEEPNAVQFAAANENFSSLVEAVTKANLAETLSGPGPFTIFAPTNEAFQKLLDSNMEWNTIDDIPTNVLTSVLTYHVVAGENLSTDLSTGYVNTLSATAFDNAMTTSMYINLDDGVTINGSTKVTAADNMVSNGVIHVVDEVIMPANIVTFATSNPMFSTLVAALTRDDLSTDFVAALNGEGPLTVFAPTNAAFQALLDSRMDWNGLADIPSNVLESVLLYHVSSAGNVRASDLSDGQVVPTLSGDNTFTIDLSGDMPMITATSNNAFIVATDVQATNGVIHVIDTVILPAL